MSRPQGAGLFSRGRYHDSLILMVNCIRHSSRYGDILYWRGQRINESVVIVKDMSVIPGQTLSHLDRTTSKFKIERRRIFINGHIQLFL